MQSLNVPTYNSINSYKDHSLAYEPPPLPQFGGYEQVNLASFYDKPLTRSASRNQLPEHAERLDMDKSLSVLFAP